MPLPSQNSPQSSCHHSLGRKKLVIPPGSILLKICFHQQKKMMEECMICCIKIKSENVKMTYDINLIFYILYDFQFFQM